MQRIRLFFAVIVFILAVFGIGSANAEEFRLATAESFEVSPIFGDNMVLQQDEPIRIWGTSSCEGEVINARMGESLGWGAVKDGKWQIELSARSFSSEAQTLEIYGSGEKAYTSFENIKIGDVWWVLGQSNVEYTVSADPEAEAFCDSFTGNENITICQLDKNTFEENRCRWRSADRYSMYTASDLGCRFAKYLSEAFAGEVPIAIVSMGYSGQNIDEFMPSDIKKGFFAKNGDIYDSVLGRVAVMPIRGLIWYQGESDADAYSDYADKLEGLIGFFRERKGSDFPVYAVELSPCFYDADDENRMFVELGCVRGELNSLTYKTENFFVCPTSDTWSDRSYSNNIHPNNKNLIARRLSLMVLSREYKFDDAELYFGPTVSKYTVAEDNTVTIYFENTGEGLQGVRNDGFVVIGEDWNAIEDCSIVQNGKNSITISADKKICIIRYATRTDAVFGENIFMSSSYGIPAAAFAINVSLPESGLSAIRAFVSLKAVLIIAVIALCSAALIIWLFKSRRR